MENLQSVTKEFLFLFPRYRFAVRNPTDVWPKWSGVKHGDELDYLFGRPFVQREKFPETDVVLTSFIMKSWANFVKLG